MSEANRKGPKGVQRDTPPKMRGGEGGLGVPCKQIPWKMRGVWVPHVKLQESTCFLFFLGGGFKGVVNQPFIGVFVFLFFWCQLWSNMVYIRSLTVAYMVSTSFLLTTWTRAGKEVRGQGQRCFVGIPQRSRIHRAGLLANLASRWGPPKDVKH